MFWLFWGKIGIKRKFQVYGILSPYLHALQSLRSVELSFITKELARFTYFAYPSLPFPSGNHQSIFSISVLSILTSPFSFIILLIWVLSLSPFFFFLMSLAKDLSILFIFSRYLLLLSLILAILLYISFISALICIIYFLLLTLGFVCSSFSSCFKCKVRCYWDFLFLEVEIILLLTSLLALLLIYPIGFGSSCFHCHLSLGIFWFPLQVLHWSIGYLVTYCLAFMCLSVLQFWFFFFFSPILDL